MKYCLFIALFLTFNGRPSISANKKRMKYGSSIKLLLTNNSAVSLYYYVNLDVLVGEYWGPADSDILNISPSKTMNYKKISTKESIVISYSTKNLPKSYLDDFHVYRFSMHVIKNLHSNNEECFYSKEIKIL